jgi:hypothetical protein
MEPCRPSQHAAHRLVDRRRFFAGSLAGLALSATAHRNWASDEGSLPPVRVITQGPKHHWFGYYDKLQFDPSNRYVLHVAVAAGFGGRDLVERP